MPPKGWRKAPDGTWTPPNEMLHTLEIEEETRDWLEEQLSGLKQTFVLGKTARSAGEVLKGVVSHPAGYLSVIGALIILAHTIPGIRDFVAKLEAEAAEAAGVAVEEFVKTGWRNVTEGSAARTVEERLMYERWIEDLWKGIQWLFRF